jgi:hypothetical protein
MPSKNSWACGARHEGAKGRNGSRDFTRTLMCDTIEALRCARRHPSGRARAGAPGAAAGQAARAAHRVGEDRAVAECARARLRSTLEPRHNFAVGDELRRVLRAPARIGHGTRGARGCRRDSANGAVAKR